MNEMMPREKAIAYGIECLDNRELLALIIKSAYAKKNVFDLVDDVLTSANGFDNLLSLSYEELVSIKGIKNAKALEIMAILEISKRLSKVDRINEERLSAPDKVVEWIRFNLAYSVQEEFLVVFLNARGSIIKHEILYKGSRNSSIVAIDEIMRKAIILKASSILCAHNHPSDNCKPSLEDVTLTKKLKEAANMLGIPLLDHIIVGKSDYFSFRNKGML